MLIHCIYLWKSLASICCERDLELMLPTHRAHFWGGALRWWWRREHTSCPPDKHILFLSHSSSMLIHVPLVYILLHCTLSQLTSEAASWEGSRSRCGCRWACTCRPRGWWGEDAVSCDCHQLPGQREKLKTLSANYTYQHQAASRYIYTVMYTVQCSGHIL